MRALRRYRALLISLLWLLALAPLAHAAVGGGSENAEVHVMGIVWQVVNFTILVVGLVIAAKLFNVRGMLAARVDGIRKGIDEATKAREAAERALEEVREKLRLKDEEIKKIIEAAERSGKSEREAAIADGRRLSQRVLEQARANIQMELDSARAEIRAEAVELAMELAARKLGERLSPDEQKSLMEEAIKKLEAAR